VSVVRESIKFGIRALATVAVAPAILSYRLRSPVMGRERALLGSTQALALVPGLLGQYLRRAFLSHVLAYCGPNAVVEWGTCFSDPDTRIDDYAYIGPNCHIGFAHIERDVLIAPCVHIPSGSAIHGTADLDEPIRNQQGVRACVRIGANSWIGSAAVVMADVGAKTIVGAGAVVNKPLPGGVIAAGVPARVVRQR
jgi:acetyltransferase-like isoleucine patch superfamily enzyme